MVAIMIMIIVIIIIITVIIIIIITIIMVRIMDYGSSLPSCLFGFIHLHKYSNIVVGQ